MSIRVALEHRTVYRFDRPVAARAARRAAAAGAALPHADPRLLAAGHAGASTSSTGSRTRSATTWRASSSPSRPTSSTVTVDLVADLTVINPFDFFVEESAEHVAVRLRRRRSRATSRRTCDVEPAGPLLDAWVAAIPRDAATAHRSTSSSRSTAACSATSPTRSAWSPACRRPTRRCERGIGSCRDSAWLLVQILRRLGLAARFVSGYLVQLADDVGRATADRRDRGLHRPARLGRGLRPRRRLDRPRPDLGPARRRGPHPARVHAAARGRRADHRADRAVRGDASSTPTSVRRAPRGPARHAALHRRAVGAHRRARPRGRRARCAAGDVRLTMGGEPTFVSRRRHGRAGVEHRRRRPDEARARRSTSTRRLADRLRARRAAPARPGQVVSRASRCRAGRSACTGAATATPLWHDRGAARRPADAPATPTAADAARSRPRSPPRSACPTTSACRPTRTRVGRLLAEARLPAASRRAGDVDPPTPRSPTPTRARRSSPRSTPTRGEPVGWVIPLHRGARRRGAGRPARWTLRRGRLVLIPGDSPIGLRLPLDALTWTPPPPDPERSPFARPSPIAAADARRSRRVESSRRRSPRCASRCATGTLYVFLPPLDRRRRTPSSCSASSRRRPPSCGGRSSSRATRRRATRGSAASASPPTPASSRSTSTRARRGPSSSSSTTTLVRRRAPGRPRHREVRARRHAHRHRRRQPPDARRRRRRPTARSCAGPTCCAASSPTGSTTRRSPTCSPAASSGRRARRRASTRRRHESLYELEIAFAELDRLRGRRAARRRGWSTALLRNLLVDLTGNTHRAEFCIDKLFSPDTRARAGSGCVELRGFEMPPHPRMALVQALLVRALVARFWARAVRGAARALGHRAARPLPAAVVRRSRHRRRRRRPARATASPSSRRGSTPFLEFRFPRIGVVARRRRHARAARRRSSRGTCSARRSAPGTVALRRLVASSGCRSGSTG